VCSGLPAELLHHQLLPDAVLLHAVLLLQEARSARSVACSPLLPADLLQHHLLQPLR
jgi:hypothetical protein